MIYQSIADIYAANDTVRRRLTERVENLSEAQQTFRPAEDAWSIAEIMDHLSIIERNMVQLIGRLLKKSEGATSEINAGDGDEGDEGDEGDKSDVDVQNAAGAPPFRPFSLDSYVEQIRDVKLTAPERVRPGGSVTLADALAALGRTRAEIEAMRPRLEAADLGAATYPHPAFGELNTAQWLAFIGEHEARHLRQIENLMAASGFERSEG